MIVVGTLLKVRNMIKKVVDMDNNYYVLEDLITKNRICYGKSIFTDNDIVKE